VRSAEILRVLHVIPSIDEKYGGPSYAVKAMMDFQNTAGIEAHIATTHQTSNKKIAGTQEFSQWNSRQVVSGGKVRHRDEMIGSWTGMDFFSFSGSLGEYKFSWGLWLWLQRNVQNYDIVHIHSIFCFSSVAAATASRRAGVPYIIRPLGQLYPWALSNRSAIKKFFYLAMFESRTIQRSSALHFTTQHEKENNGLSGAMPFSYVLPLGVRSVQTLSTEMISSLWPDFSSKKILFSLSRLHPKKGLHLLIPWLSSFLKKSYELVLVIAGRGQPDYERILRDLVAQYQIADKVFFLGEISGIRKEALLQSCYLFILPSQSENFGIAVAEALFVGAPVLISDQVGLASDVIESQAGLVFALNKESFERQFKPFIENPDFRARCAVNAAEFAHKKYNWEAITQQQRNFYEEVIAANRKELA